ncbi:GntR family transcriptional regulator [Undibacterium sp. TC4M20W]|jgi:DNA-binding GntR family transcriptional regulator|uniref:GntR family transcriptional regulator n=1 Tax=Undibacterium TaxID=401469 RepID=UPI001331CE80|nr:MULTISPECIES: GntR family transcriptional regulator [unclassified Undibacterium]MBI3731766.1 GntR family transcriptional regulator [Burkholderiales bacterium]BBB61738.1 GntR family transcriptional regulator [Undibacterium sp. KW1]BBB67795.1 GntR family transcriptional regulator [Undibacterium sp. YM2]
MLATPEKTPAFAPKLRAADVAYDAIESMIVTLQLKPGSPVVESELVERTGLGRTPLREALMRMSSNGLIQQMPRRGLIISDIEAAEHMTLIETRRVIERLIGASAARRATPQHRKDIIECADKMLVAAKRNDLNDYMAADQALDHVVHEACRNPSAVAAVIPLIIKCRRFWYAFQHEGDIEEGARCHMLVAKAIAKGNEEQAAKAADGLMDYLESFARKVIG